MYTATSLVQPLATTFMILVQELSENEWISSDRLIYLMVKLIVIIPLQYKMSIYQALCLKSYVIVSDKLGKLKHIRIDQYFK